MAVQQLDGSALDVDKQLLFMMMKIIIININININVDESGHNDDEGEVL